MRRGQAGRRGQSRDQGVISGLGAGGWEPRCELEKWMRTAKPGVAWEARSGREGQEGPGPRAHGVKGVKVCDHDKAHRL